MSFTKSMTFVDGVAQDTIVDDYELSIRADESNPVQVLLKMKPNDVIDTAFGVVATLIPAGELWTSTNKFVRGDLKVVGGTAYAVLRY
jgi:hypothetical protein